MRKLALLLAILVAAACGDDPMGPPGSISVVVTTRGVDRDASFVVRVGDRTMDVGSGTSAIIGALRPGRHEVTLEGLAANCAAAGALPRSVSVRSGQSAAVEFIVNCTSVTGAIAVRTAMSGSGGDADGFTIQLGTTPVRTVPAGDSVTYVDLAGGDYQVTLGDLAPNCTASGQNPRTVTVTTGTAVRDTSRTTFAVTCIQFVGTIRVVTRTTGAELDPDGYSLQLDGSVTLPGLGANVTVDLPGITAQDHSLRLNGIAPNCALAGANPRIVTVARDAVLEVVLEVACAATRGDIRIIAQTTGFDFDPDGYRAVLNVREPVALPVNGSITMTGLAAGAYSLRIDDIAPNCTLSGPNPRPLAVAAGGTTEITVALTCVAISRVDVTASTSGTDPDRTGYTIALTSGSLTETLVVPASGTISFERLAQGTYTMRILDVAPNCEVSGSSTRSIEARSAIIPVSFAVTCTILERIAFSMWNNGNEDIYSSKADGSDQTRLTTHPGSDYEPSWSAAAGHIAFYSLRDGYAAIYVMPETGGGETRLTGGPGNSSSPAWSPDGQRIAFQSDRSGTLQIYVMNADGSNVIRVTSSTANDISPSWSPDGTRLAFTRSTCGGAFGCLGNVWLVSPDGQNLTRLTDTGLDGEPAWSPDGTRIVFARVNQCFEWYYFSCERNLVVMNADGSGVTPLAGDSFDEGKPSWSPGGARLVTSLYYCGYYGCSDPAGIRMVRPDGSDPVHVVTGQARHGAFRR